MRTMRDAWAELTDDERAAVPRYRKGAASVGGDRPARRGTEPLAGLVLLSESAVNPKARCPGCGRARPLDALRDIQQIPAAERREMLVRAGVRGADAPAICGACISRLHRTGTLARPALYQRLGASAEVVARHQRIADRRATRRPQR